jgi:hypothetical protein
MSVLGGCVGWFGTASAQQAAAAGGRLHGRLGPRVECTAARPRLSPPGERDSSGLLEDLCLALRKVAMHEGYYRPDERTHQAVRDVLAVAAELDRRRVDAAPRLEQLSKETSWLMQELLAECRRLPDGNPRVRDLEGIRRYLRCPYCRVAERPESDEAHHACDACLSKMAASFESLMPVPGTVLFRTYSPEWRCVHADGDTVLVSMRQEDEGFLAPGECRRCIEAALARRPCGGPGAR